MKIKKISLIYGHFTTKILKLITSQFNGQCKIIKEIQYINMSINKPLHGSNCAWLCRRSKHTTRKLHAQNPMFENGMSARHARTHFSSPNIGFCTRSKAMQSIGNYFLYALTFDMVMRSWNRLLIPICN